VLKGGLKMSVDVEKVKSEALKYANLFAKNEDVTIKLNFDFSVAENYLVTIIAQIYYNAKAGIITREEAKKQQKNAFLFVEEHKEIFE
jgi:hypothetical protein